MKKIGLGKKLFAFLLSAVFMLSMVVPALATTAPFSTGGAGSNPFHPRGYSIVENGTQYWLDSNYTHNYKSPTDNVHSAIWSDDTNPANSLTKISYVTSGDKQMYAWLDKGQSTSSYNMPFQRGFTTDSTVDVRYFFVVSINDGPFVTVPYAEAAAKNLTDGNGNVDAAQGLSSIGYANRNVIDPDGCTNDWVYPLTFKMAPGTKYTFAYLRGFAANNGMSLILSPDTTADGQSGYAGVLQGPSLTDAERAEYAAHNQDLYQYVYGLTDLGLGTGTGKEVYSIAFKDFYHTVQTYADLTALNNKISEATTFAGSVTDDDYKLGTYRKSSVDALNALIDEINAITDLNDELQTTVDALTTQLSYALTVAKVPAVLVSGVTLNQNKADMNVGDTLTLKATVSPENADNQNVTWTSSNDHATVDNGVVTAVSAGDVAITAKTEDGGYTATCAITVNNVDKSVANTDSSVGVDFNTAALPAGVSVGSVNNIVVTSGTDETGIINALSAIGFSNLSINDVQLLDTEGNPISNLTSNVTVKIKIPDGSASMDLNVFWYDPATGNLTNMNATQQDGYLVFNTNHFSYYIVAQANPTTTTTTDTTTTDTTITTDTSATTTTTDTTAATTTTDTSATATTTDTSATTDTTAATTTTDTSATTATTATTDTTATTATTDTTAATTTTDTSATTTTTDTSATTTTTDTSAASTTTDTLATTTTTDTAATIAASTTSAVSSDNPQTSDNSPVNAICIVGGLSIAALLTIKLGRRNKNQAK